MIRSVADIAPALGVSKQRVNQLASAAHLPKFKMRGRGGANGYDHTIEGALSASQWAKVAPLFVGAVAAPAREKLAESATPTSAVSAETESRRK